MCRIFKNSFSHMPRLNLEDRKFIEENLNENVPVRKIALQLKVNPTTIFREIKRCPAQYNHKEAQENSLKRVNTIDFSIIGKKFGMLTILEYSSSKNHRSWWKASCDCGQETRISRKTLIDKMSDKYPFNCGCQGKINSYKKIREKEISLLSRYHCLMKMIEKHDGCWIWTGHINKVTKVPMTSWNSVSMSVRRLLYKIFNEQDIDHVYASCGDRTCVNPRHFAIGVPKKGHYLN